MKWLRTQRDLNRAVNGLRAVEPRFDAVLAVVDRPRLRRHDPGFRALLQIIVEQQLSIHAARAIWDRFETALGEITPARVAAADPAHLATLGLSRPKIRYAHALAGAVGGGDLDLDAVANLPAEKAIAELTAVKGVGRWTAEIYLLFCVGHGDIWPAGDLALRASAQALFELPERPEIKEFDAMAEPWRPWRGVAALLLWDYYRHVKGMPAAVGVSQ